MSECGCKKRENGFQYPTFSDLESAALLFRDNGYIVVRNLFSVDEVAQTCSEISKVCSQWYANFLKTGQEDKTANEIANRRPAWRNGSWQPEPGQEELGFRKLFRMTVQNEFFAQKAKHEKVCYPDVYQHDLIFLSCSISASSYRVPASG